MNKWAFVVGRFQIFHNHHKALIDRALMEAPNVLVVIGSYNAYRTRKNPFLASERQAMMRACYPGVRRLKFVYAFDQGDDTLWRAQIEQRLLIFTGDYRALLVANCKPGEDYLQKIFHDYPQSITNHNYRTSATEIRERYFRGEPIDKFVPTTVHKWLMDFALTKTAHMEAFDAHWNEYDDDESGIRKTPA